MKPGDEVICPHCGKDSFASKKTLMDGWTKLGDILVCAVCGAKLADLDGDGNRDAGKDGGDGGSRPTSSLAAALGVDEVERPTLDAAEDERRFCRDCKHYISHPFMDRCSLLDKKVAPMDDCDRFERE
ncbi:MAG: hypothetical protein GXP32_02240 [Kiritimatiellaeota bacterium]|nr:hypothetical protein [Kiritimatiellota bacterium]